MKILFLLFLILFFYSEGRNLNTCYRAYFFFFPVAHSCILYKDSGNYIEMEAYIRTAGLGNILYRINNYGKSLISKDGRTFVFFLLQEEGNYKRDMFYYFDKGKVSMYVVKYSGKKKDIEYTRFAKYESINAYDPIFASLLIYCHAFIKKAGKIPVFYDGNIYNIPFFVAGYSEDEDSIIVEIKPRIRTSGIIKPAGEWIVWIDHTSGVPIRMELEFTIGSASVVLKKKEGEEDTVRKICENLER